MLISAFLYTVLFIWLLLGTTSLLMLVFGDDGSKNNNYNNNDLYTPCIQDESEVIYVNGDVSFGRTFIECYSNLANPGLIPTFINGTYNGIERVNISVGLNNLQSINAVDATATIDLYLRLYWLDPRLSMPPLWDKMGNVSKEDGVDVTAIWFNTEEFLLWLPDIQFNDAAAEETLVQKISINKQNEVAWSRHMVVTFVQEQLNFDDYPTDTQSLKIRMGSYTYSSEYLVLGFGDKPALFLTYSYDGEVTFKQNPIWSYDSSKYETYETKFSKDSYVLYTIKVGRQSEGTILRLVLPITLLLLLAGLTFWASYEDRVNSTTTLLLAVSALYIVILDNIPLLGYLTHIDKFVFWMFLLLVLVVAMHQAYHTLREKLDEWPLRAIYLRLMELVGRCFVIPAVIAYYLVQINDDPLTEDLMISIVTSLSVIILCKEIFEVYRTAKITLDLLLTKFNNEDTKESDCSTVEIIVLNYWMFRRFSTDIVPIAEYLHKHGMLDSPTKKPLQIRNLYAFQQSTGAARGIALGNSRAAGVGGRDGGSGGGGIHRNYDNSNSDTCFGQSTKLRDQTISAQQGSRQLRGDALFGVLQDNPLLHELAERLGHQKPTASTSSPVHMRKQQQQDQQGQQQQQQHEAVSMEMTALPSQSKPTLSSPHSLTRGLSRENANFPGALSNSDLDWRASLDLEDISALRRSINSAVAIDSDSDDEFKAARDG